MKKISLISISIIVLVVLSLSVIILNSRCKEKEYFVCFFNENELLIKTDKVSSGSNAVPPYYEVVDKTKVFIGWDQSFNNVQKNLDIYPIIVDISEESNVLYSSFACSNKGDDIEIDFSIIGNVNFCCLEIEIEFDSNYLSFDEVVNFDGDGVYNLYEGKVYYSFASANNINGSVDFLTLKLKKLKNTTNNENLISIKVIDIASLNKNNNFVDEEYKIVNSDIILN